MSARTRRRNRISVGDMLLLLLVVMFLALPDTAHRFTTGALDVTTSISTRVADAITGVIFDNLRDDRRPRAMITGQRTPNL